MGLIVLHSGHFSKIFKRLMGTSCDLKWREAQERERIWVVSPGHPIAAGLGEYFEIPHEEMYGEHFDIPEPDSLVFVSWFQGGEVFRSGCCYYRGQGKIFYFRPGHETHPTYYQSEVQQVIANAVRWAAPVDRPLGNLRPSATDVGDATRNIPAEVADVRRLVESMPTFQPESETHRIAPTARVGVCVCAASCKESASGLLSMGWRCAWGWAGSSATTVAACLSKSKGPSSRCKPFSANWSPQAPPLGAHRRR